jgi:hypothetical protein
MQRVQKPHTVSFNAQRTPTFLLFYGSHTEDGFYRTLTSVPTAATQHAKGAHWDAAFQGIDLPHSPTERRDGPSVLTTG